MIKITWQLPYGHACVRAVEVRAEEAGEALQKIQGADVLKGFGVELDGGMGGEDAGAAALALFGVPPVGRAVGAEKKLRIAARGGAD